MQTVDRGWMLLRYLLLSALTSCVVLQSRSQVVGNVEPDPMRISQSRLLGALTVHFEVGGHAPVPVSLTVLDALADVLTTYPDIRIEIAGHTDGSGSPANNQRLSEDRALSVREYLVARHGIDPNRLEIAGYGSRLPVASNRTAAGRALNRRVDFRVLDRRQRTETSPQDADRLREETREQIEASIRAALDDVTVESETGDYSDIESRIENRLAQIERRLDEEAPPPSIPPPQAVPLSRDRGFALLPFAGFYLQEQLPIILGLRLDMATTLLGAPRFQPEGALGFKPAGDRFGSVGANLIFPIELPSRAVPAIFFGGGVGIHNVESLEALLNLAVGVEFATDFGTLFAELLTQDLGDYNRIVIGYRQAF